MHNTFTWCEFQGCAQSIYKPGAGNPALGNRAGSVPTATSEMYSSQSAKRCSMEAPPGSGWRDEKISHKPGYAEQSESEDDWEGDVNKWRRDERSALTEVSQMVTTYASLPHTRFTLSRKTRSRDEAAGFGCSQNEVLPSWESLVNHCVSKFQSRDRLSGTIKR